MRIGFDGGLRGFWRPAGGLLLAGWLMSPACGCAPVSDKVLTDEDGEQIRLSQVTQIVTNDELTEAEQRERLEALGITNEGLLAVFLGGG